MRATLLTSWDERCGIAVYSRRLVDALHAQAQIAPSEVPHMEVVPATFAVATHHAYAEQGRALNRGDVAHVQHSYAFFGGMHPLRSGWQALVREVRRPLVLTIHELDNSITGAYHLPAPVERYYKRWFNRATFRHPAIRRWLTHSEAIREALLELGAPETHVTYRPLPLDPPPAQLPDPQPLRERFGLNGKHVLVILGFLAVRKGYDVALEALRRLPNDYVLLAAGGEHAADPTGTEARLRAEAARVGVSDRFHITGYLSDLELEQATSLAEVVLAPFHDMSASASLNFALARRKPVIASDLPANRSLDCVRLFPTGNAEALAAAIRDLSRAPEERIRLSQAAERYACAHSYAALAEFTVELYAELLREQR